MSTVRLAAEELGGGPPIVVLHGLLGSGTNWRSIARRLAANHRVVLVDMRNHGASPHARPMDYATLAADVLALLDDRGLESAALMGHSMGGKAAMWLALEQPRRVSRLCIVDIAPVLSTHDHRVHISALRRLDLARVSTRAEADRRLADAIPEAALRGFFLQNLRPGPEGFEWRIDLEAIDAAHDDLLAFPALPGGARYDGQCLFVRGALSDYLLDRHEAAIARLFSNARIRTIARAGHWVHAERPAAFLDIVTPFFAA